MKIITIKDKKALLSKQNIYLTIKKLFLVDIEESIKKKVGTPRFCYQTDKHPVQD